MQASPKAQAQVLNNSQLKMLEREGEILTQAKDLSLCSTYQDVVPNGDSTIWGTLKSLQGIKHPHAQQTLSVDRIHTPHKDALFLKCA